MNSQNRIYFAALIITIFSLLTSSSVFAYTCYEVGGGTCNGNQECNGHWYTAASDTDFCCIGYCESTTQTSTYTPSCTAQYLGNYRCSGNYQQQQYQYSDCSTTWQTLQYCSNGCSNGYCQSGCSAQYLNNYQCYGNIQQQQFQNSDCSTTWRNIQTCASSCSNGQCISTTTSTTTTTSTSPPPSCIIQSTGAYRCSGNTQQVQYQFADCSLQWVNLVNCQNGCSNGQCISGPGCSAQYLNNYQCSGNQLQQQYQNSDCSTSWQNVQYCSNGCSNGQCLSVANYPIYQNQPYQYPIFQFLAYPHCNVGVTNNYQCSGNMRQVQYQNSDCTTYWQTVENCQNGCANGICIATSTSTVTVTVAQQPFYDFSYLGTFVLILGIIVLLIIFIRLLNGYSPRNYRGEPEY